MEPLHEDLWEWEDGGDGPRLIGGRCGECDRPHFPLGPSCPSCGSDQVARTTLSPSGTLWGWTTVTNAPPGYEGPVPFGFGVVELPEGIRVITRLRIEEPAAAAFGDPMVLVLDELPVEGATRTMYAFAPAASA